MDGSASSQGIAMVIASVRTESGHDIAPRTDLSDPVERERLSSSALHAFFKIAELWKIREIDARMLLGGVSKNTYHALKKENARTLDEDMIRRISYLICIFEGLNIKFGEKLADEWVHLPNTNIVFGGSSPLEYLMNGDLSSFATVGELLDGPRGGH